MTTYPRHVTRASRRAAERLYARPAHLYVPDHQDLDDVVRVDDGNTFAPHATPDRRTDDDEH